MRQFGLALATVLTVLPLIPAAWAQSDSGNGHVMGVIGGGAGERGRRGAGAARGSKPGAESLPTLRAQDVWPRLDAGAVICESRDELVARARHLGQAADTPELPAGCRLVRSVVGVTVIDRSPPAATEVKLKDSGEVGWTDAYLPDRAPGS